MNISERCGLWEDTMLVYKSNYPYSWDTRILTILRSIHLKIWHRTHLNSQVCLDCLVAWKVLIDGSNLRWEQNLNTSPTVLTENFIIPCWAQVKIMFSNINNWVNLIESNRKYLSPYPLSEDDNDFIIKWSYLKRKTCNTTNLGNNSLRKFSIPLLFNLQTLPSQ